MAIRAASATRRVRGRLIGAAVVFALVQVRATAAVKADAAPATPQITSDGRKIVTARETRAPIALDGALDEAVWREAEATDGFEVILDTFADRRNGFVFVVNPAGAKADTHATCG